MLKEFGGLASKFAFTQKLIFAGELAELPQ
jgi:hypothetical protein